ncbi:MAG: hypothetical protein CMG46_02245 [Candidatus Marinimicrobia bacterium]|nr:hypothetical protein [Candidatus Neomarinimicrobiota bacterium]|tara:strand:+ start:281 stop:595 length:315 start_codon:yes stop_codon:yes gene_type:complete
MNQLNRIIKYDKLIPYCRGSNKNVFILSKDKVSPLTFIEITPKQYRFVFDGYDKHMKLNQDMKDLLLAISKESIINRRISIENLSWCGGGITIIYNYKKINGIS